MIIIMMIMIITIIMIIMMLGHGPVTDLHRSCDPFSTRATLCGACGALADRFRRRTPRTDPGTQHC